MFLSLSLILVFVNIVSSAVTVTRTDQGPTGYEVTITYQNASVSNVMISGLPHLTDQYSTSWWSWSGFDLSEYKPGDFPRDPLIGSYYVMKNETWGIHLNTTPLQRNIPVFFPPRLCSAQSVQHNNGPGDYGSNQSTF